MIKTTPPPMETPVTPDPKAPFGSAARRAAMDPGPRLKSIDDVLREAGLTKTYTLDLTYASEEEVFNVSMEILKMEHVSSIERHRTMMFLNHAMGQELELRKLQNRMDATNEESVTDPLTGLNKRAPLVSALNQSIDIVTKGIPSNKAVKGYALAFVDLQHFKRVNDLYGNNAGDDALIETAQRLTKAAGRKDGRRKDIVSRFGGDEFVVLAALTGKEDIVSFEQRLKKQIAKMSVEFEGKTIEFGARVGVFEVKPGQVAAQLIQEASLYMDVLKQDEDRLAHKKAPAATGGGRPLGDVPRAPAIL